MDVIKTSLYPHIIWVIYYFFKACYCPIDPRLNFTQANKLIRELQVRWCTTLSVYVRSFTLSIAKKELTYLPRMPRAALDIFLFRPLRKIASRFFSSRNLKYNVVVYVLFSFVNSARPPCHTGSVHKATWFTSPPNRPNYSRYGELLIFTRCLFGFPQAANSSIMNSCQSKESSLELSEPVLILFVMLDLPGVRPRLGAEAGMLRCMETLFDCVR